MGQNPRARRYQKGDETGGSIPVQRTLGRVSELRCLALLYQKEEEEHSSSSMTLHES